MTEIRIYFEGDKTLRSGFRCFLSRIGDATREKRIGFSVIPAGGAPKADFQLAQKTHPNAWNILLQDSEGPDAQNEDSVFWMVQLMEAWFLADPEALASYYGDGFVSNALKPNPRVEEIPKADVLECLKQATRKTQKGAYHKTGHAPRILASISPDKVRRVAPNCDRLFQEVLAKINE